MRIPEEFLLKLGKTYIFTASGWSNPFYIYKVENNKTLWIEQNNVENLEQNDIILILDFWWTPKSIKNQILEDINYKVLVNDKIGVVQNLDLIFVKELC